MAIPPPAAGRILLSWGIAITNAVNELLAADTLLAANRPIAQLQHGISDTIPSGVWTAVEFNIVIVDTHEGFNPTTPTRYTAPQPGWYRLAGGAGWNAFAGGTRATRWRRNAAVIDGGQLDFPPLNALMAVPARTILVPLDTGDFIELQVFQSSGAAQSSFGGGSFGATMTIEWVRQR